MAMRPRTGVQSAVPLPRAGDGEGEPGGTSVSSVATTPSETARRVLVRRAAGRAAWASSPGVATEVTLVLALFDRLPCSEACEKPPPPAIAAEKLALRLVGRRPPLS